MDSRLLRRLRGDLLLLLAAAIWGLTFVAQIRGMDHLGPFAFMALRFSIAAIALIPLAAYLSPSSDSPPVPVWIYIAAGAFLFAGSALQQVGLQYTSAAKAGFITSLYILLVPLLGLIWGLRAGWPVWVGVSLAVPGLYLLSIDGVVSINRGDMLQLVGAGFWAGHVLFIGWAVSRANVFRLAAGQAIACAAASWMLTLWLESPTLVAVLSSLPALLFAGVLSTAGAFTFQIMGQRDVPPAPAALIMSLEALFAALGGWWLLSEQLTTQEWLGCVLIFAGILIGQYRAEREDS